MNGFNRKPYYSPNVGSQTRFRAPYVSRTTQRSSSDLEVIEAVLEDIRTQCRNHSTRLRALSRDIVDLRQDQVVQTSPSGSKVEGIRCDQKESKLPLGRIQIERSGKHVRDLESGSSTGSQTSFIEKCKKGNKTKRNTLVTSNSSTDTSNSKLPK